MKCSFYSEGYFVVFLLKHCGEPMASPLQKRSSCSISVWKEMTAFTKDLFRLNGCHQEVDVKG